MCTYLHFYAYYARLKIFIYHLPSGPTVYNSWPVLINIVFIVMGIDLALKIGSFYHSSSILSQGLT